jgi:hypothetical protein
MTKNGTILRLKNTFDKKWQYKKSSIPQKRTSINLKQNISALFSFLQFIFANVDPDIKISANPDPQHWHKYKENGVRTGPHRI